jgi:hypothetical protein
MKSSIIFLLILFISLPAFCQNSIIALEDIEFKTDTEKGTFASALKGKTTVSVLPLLMDSYEPSSVTVNEANGRIDHAVKYIGEHFMKNKTDARRIKNIYDYVHDEFMISYKTENSFFEIFKEGSFNSLSASALFAVIFSRLGIPYVVKEMPTHVYLIAYPSTSAILIESTSSNDAYYHFTNRFMQKYVEELLAGNQISQKEIDSSSVETIFNQYFYEKREIDLLNLSALQFYNYGLYLSDKKKYTQSIE